MKALTIRNNKENYEFTYNLPLDNNFNGEILVNTLYNIICVYDGTILKLFEYIEGNKELYEFELPEFDNKILNIKSIFYSKQIMINDKIYFCFCFLNKQEKLFSFYINIDLENNIFISNIFETNYDYIMDEEFEFININSNIYIYKKNKNKKIKLISLNNDKEYEIEIKNNFNKIKFIYNDKFKYNINEIPFFIYDNSNGTSSLLFIDFENKNITEYKINNLYFTSIFDPSIDYTDFVDKKILKYIFIKNDDKYNYFKFVYLLNGEDKYILIKIKKYKNTFHNLDTEIVINSGLETGNTYLSIKSNSPAYNDKNDNLFLSKPVSDTDLIGISDEENEEINIESVDENKVNNNSIYKNEFEINNFIREPNFDNIEFTESLCHPIEKKESIIVQEFSNDMKGTVFLLSKNVNENERNKLIIRSKKYNNNTPIVIEGKCIKSENNNEKNFNIIHTNSCALPPSNNNKYIFPFINKSNNIFSGFSLDKGEIFIAQNIFLNYINIYKYNKDSNHNLFTNILENENNVITKLLVCSYIKNCLGQDELTSVIDNSQHMKIICERFGLIDKNDIIDTSLELLSNSENKDSIFEYINEYGGYKFKG